MFKGPWPMDDAPVKDSLRLMLHHFGRVEDPRESWRVRFWLPELLFLVTSASIAGCDDSHVRDFKV